MFRDLVEQFHNLKDHHQVLITLVVAFSAICLTWGLEKLLEKYFFPKRPEIGYIVAVVGSLLLLWLVKHFLLHEI